MSSPTLNVVRYTALFSGVLYGIAHRRTLQREADAAKIEHAVHHREHLVAQAKEAWKQQQLAGKSDGIITDPEDPKFDIEKLVAKWEKDYA